MNEFFSADKVLVEKFSCNPEYIQYMGSTGPPLEAIVSFILFDSEKKLNSG